MPKKLEKETQVETPKAEPKVVDAKVDKTRVQVFDSRGNLAREYTLAVHGEKMDDYAKGYAKKIGGSYQYPIIL